MCKSKSARLWRSCFASIQMHRHSSLPRDPRVVVDVVASVHDIEFLVLVALCVLLGLDGTA